MRDKEREILKAEKEREMRLNKERDRERLDKSKIKIESRTSDKPRTDKNVDRNKLTSREHDIKKSIDLKSQNTYRIDKNSNEKKVSVPQKSSDQKYMNGHSSQGKPVPKLSKDSINRSERDRIALMKQKSLANDSSLKLNGSLKTEKRLPESKGAPQKKLVPNSNSSAGPSKPVMSNSFDFDKHVNSLGKNGTKQFPPGMVRRKPHPDDRNKLKREYIKFLLTCLLDTFLTAQCKGLFFWVMVFAFIINFHKLY